MASIHPSLTALPTAPAQRWGWVRPLIPKPLQPYLRGLRKRLQWSQRNTLEEPLRSVWPYTQVNRTRQRNLLRLCGELEARQVPGAIVECGVLDGGTAALMGYATSASGRPIHLFDAWEGLPATTAEDGTNAAVWTGEVVGSPTRVIAALRALKVDPARAFFHHGWFHETFPTANVEQIALLHVDADFYEPTKLILQRWMPHMVPGGFVQIDDYDSFAGCRRAVEEYLAKRPDLTLEYWGDVPAARACFIRIAAA